LGGAGGGGGGLLILSASSGLTASGATGLGGGKKPAREERREQLKVVKNGTDGTTMEVPDFQQPDFDKPSVFRARSGRGAPQQVDFSNPSVGDSFDIPAFLRRQAD